MRRTRIGVAAVVCLFAAAMLTALAGTHVTPPSVTAQTRYASPPDGGRPSFPPQKRDHGGQSLPERATSTGKNTSVLGIVVTVAVGLFVLASLYGLIHVLAGMVRDLRPKGRYARRSTARRDAAPVSVPAALRRAVDAGLEELRSEQVSSTDAIIAAWVALRDAAAASGIASRPTDTPEDLVRRVLGRWQVSADALATLADLYREARFSEHRLDDAARAAALGALESVRADLAAASAAASGVHA